MNGYLVFYGHHKAEVWAKTTLAAVEQYAKLYNVPKSRQYKISAHLCQRADGSEVIHVAVD